MSPYQTNVNPKRSILVVGSANMDMVVSTARFPRPGETVLAHEFGMYAGGKGANQAVAASRLGAHVSLLAKMGRDMFRERLMESLTTHGVDARPVLVDAEAPTGVALITVDEAGQNEIVVVSGSNMRLSADDVLDHAALFDRADIVMLQLEIPLETVEAAARIARAKGARVILNPAPAASLPGDLLAHVDVLTPNESEIELLTGASVSGLDSIRVAARDLIKQGVNHVVVTLGDRGAVHVTKTGARHHAAYDVSAVDSTAAGDAFNGALAFALSRGDTVDDAVPFANAVAACCVTQMGAQASLPTFAEVEALRERKQTIDTE